MNSLLNFILGKTGLGWLTVHIRQGYLRGSRWTLWPCSSYWRSTYEPDVQAALLRHTPAKGTAAWDLGAHCGFYSLWLARAVGPQGEIIAIEPDPTSFKRLSRHALLNPDAPIRPMVGAASDLDGVLNLIQSEGAGATTSHLAYAGETPAKESLVSVRTFRLDTIATRENLRPPTLIKIDVEGHAAAALRGAIKTLKQHRPRLLISLHSAEECEGVRALIEPLGYQPALLEDDSPVSWESTLYKTAWFTLTK